MHTVMWTFKVPAGTAKAQLVETINATAHTYEGIPGDVHAGLYRKSGAREPQKRLLCNVFGVSDVSQHLIRQIHQVRAMSTPGLGDLVFS